MPDLRGPLGWLGKLPEVESFAEFVCLTTKMITEAYNNAFAQPAEYEHALFDMQCVMDDLLAVYDKFVDRQVKHET